MKINTKIPEKLVPYFKRELNNAAIAFKLKHYHLCWQHLERAHILGQPYPLAHTIVHYKMLGFGISTKNIKEVFGQIPRLVFGGVKSFVGEIPIGNTGGANVPPLKPMQIPEDLSQIIHQTKK
jgi:hypothetical protein